jgi:hypothetical protein
MAEVWKEVLMNLIYLGIVILVPTLIYGVKKGAAALVEYLSTKTNKSILDTIMAEITTFVSESVTYVMQTYVDSMKKSGKFDKESQKTAYNMAYDAAVKLIPTESKEMFESVYGSLDEYLKILIEAEVKKLKQQEELAGNNTIKIDTNVKESTE